MATAGFEHAVREQLREYFTITDRTSPGVQNPLWHAEGYTKQMQAGQNPLAINTRQTKPVRRRDRRGRGIRGPLIPQIQPGYLTRTERFESHLLDIAALLEKKWGSKIDGLEFAVELVPPSDPAPWERWGVPLGRYFPAEPGLSARVVVYRKPIENQSLDVLEVGELVRAVVMEQVATHLGVPIEDVL